MLDLQARHLDASHLRHAGREVLSLALMDARNQSLRWIAACETALGGPDMPVPRGAEINPPLWEIGHVGWFQEHWIGRNLQRRRGVACEPGHARLASILPHADRWFDSTQVAHASRWELDLPGLDVLRAYLVDTLESTLELLHGSPEDDASLYFYRLALFHEEMHIEALAILSQTLGFDAGLLARPASLAARAPLLFPATRWTLGGQTRGFAFDNELGALELEVPEFEIDAQPVSWAQYSEFVEDGGYDEARHWHPDGWAWVGREGRRTPRHVEQMRHGVLQRRFGQAVRVPMAQPAVHLSWYEADAWCRWADRRLPGEAEWDLAAHQGGSRGFRWGEVWEWTATRFAPYPGFVPHPYRDYSLPWFHTHKVLRGASLATRPGLRSPSYRNFYLPTRDDIYAGFRSCAA